MNMYDAFRQGALALANETMAYTAVHRDHGLSQEDWKLITQKELWNIKERQRVRSILGECVMISLTLAGLPAQSLPGQYVAAVIATIVSPANMLVASTRAPEAFDAMAASGVVEGHEIKPMPPEQMQSLVLAYAGSLGDEPPAHKLGNDKESETKK